MRALLLTALLAGCTSDSKTPSPPLTAPPKPPVSTSTDKPGADGEVLPPYARTPMVTRPGELGKPLEWNATPPTLETAITGFVVKDAAAAELDRCKLTAWSYAGCWNVYPTQGRIWTRFECEHVVDDYQRVIICRNYAEHLAVGDGGPPDPTAAAKILQDGCDHKERHSCTVIAELLIWNKDLSSVAAQYRERGCGPDTIGNGGLCDDLFVGPKLLRYSVTLTDATGLDGITTSTACSLGVIARKGGDCRVHFACGDRVLYGAFNGTAPCKATDAGPVGGETMTTPDDNDPAIEFDGQTVHLHDAASATAPAWDLRGTLKRE